jgi:hypothetical protein
MGLIMTKSYQAKKRWRFTPMVLLAAATAPLLAATYVRSVTIPSGTKLVGKLMEDISTKENKVGDPVEVRTVRSIHGTDGTVPSGVLLRGEIVESEHAGLTGHPKIAIRFTELRTEGETYRITTQMFELQGKSETKETAKKTGIGAIAGGVVGAIAGSAGKGILIGAVLGTGYAVVTHDGHIGLAKGQRMEVELLDPVTVRVEERTASR